MADLSFAPEDEIARLSLSQAGQQPPAPPPPSVNSRGVVASDITDKFSQAVSTLSPGELVKDGLFTLFESVAALEIMDPKMDSGCVEPGDEFEELYDVSRTLLPKEVLGIMDQLLCYEMSWHLGYPLSQTVFTSVYVEALLMPKPRGIDQARFVRHKDPSTAEEPMSEILRAYCLGMLKTCGYVNQRIMEEHYYEEEDFVTNTYHRTLLDTIATDSIRDVILAAIELVESQRGSVDDALLDAITARLDLRYTVLSVVESPEHILEPARARDPLEKGLALLPQIKNSHSLGKSVPEAFSEKLQRKLASTMPPRPIVEIPFDEAFGHLTRLFQDGLELLGVLDYTDSQCLQTFVSTFQGKTPQPLVYVRTLLQTFLFHEMEVLGRMSIRQILDDDLSIVVLPASQLLDRANDEVEVVHDPRFAISQHMELFRQKAAQPFLDILRTSCQNRCRVRRTLFHILRAWDSLQMDAEDIDQLLQMKLDQQSTQNSSAGAAEVYALPLSSWTYLYKLRQMEEIVHMGFELEIYPIDELAGMYWYLNYLAKHSLQHAERIKSFAARTVETLRAAPHHALPGAEKQLSKSLAFIRLTLLRAAVTWELSDALTNLYTVLGRLGLVKGPPRPYSSDELRYELRMKPFATVGLPALPTYKEFTASTSQARTSEEVLLDYGDRGVTGAKKGLEAMSKLSPEDSFSVGSHDRWASVVKSQLKSCIAAGLAIAAVRKAMQQRDENGDIKITAEVPTPDKAYHAWWIIPRIVPNK